MTLERDKDRTRRKRAPRSSKHVRDVKPKKVKKKYPAMKPWDRGPEPTYAGYPLDVNTVGTASEAERQAAIIRKHGRLAKIWETPSEMYMVRAGPKTTKSKKNLQHVKKQRKHLAEHGAVEWGAGPEKAKDYNDYYTLLRLEKGKSSLTNREQYPHDFRGMSKKKTSFEDIPGYYEDEDEDDE